MEICGFELAKKLNEKGFRENCLFYYTSIGGLFSNSIDTYDRPNQELDYSDFLKCYNNGNSLSLIDAPTISQVLKWLRETHNIHINIYFFKSNGNTELYWAYSVENIKDDFEYDWLYSTRHDTYEEAALAGIDYVLDNILI